MPHRLDYRMAGQLLPPPELAPLPVPDNATPAQCIAMWADLVDACEQFVIAALRREIGPDGDLRAACRRWCAERREDRDRAILHMAEMLDRCGGGRAG
jgi:hypothetical protein